MDLLLPLCWFTERGVIWNAMFFIYSLYIISTQDMKINMVSKVPIV